MIRVHSLLLSAYLYRYKLIEKNVLHFSLKQIIIHSETQSLNRLSA